MTSVVLPWCGWSDRYTYVVQTYNNNIGESNVVCRINTSQQHNISTLQHNTQSVCTSIRMIQQRVLLQPRSFSFQHPPSLRPMVLLLLLVIVIVLVNISGMVVFVVSTTTSGIGGSGNGGWRSRRPSRYSRHFLLRNSVSAAGVSTSSTSSSSIRHTGMIVVSHPPPLLGYSVLPYQCNEKKLSPSKSITAFQERRRRRRSSSHYHPSLRPVTQLVSNNNKSLSHSRNLPRSLSSSSSTTTTPTMELSVLGTIVAGTVEIATATVMNYITGYVTGYVMGTIIGIPQSVWQHHRTTSGSTTPKMMMMLPKSSSSSVFFPPQWMSTIHHKSHVQYGRKWGNVSGIFGGCRTLVTVVRRPFQYHPAAETTTRSSSSISLLQQQHDKWNDITSSVLAGALLARSGTLEFL